MLQQIAASLLSDPDTDGQFQLFLEKCGHLDGWYDFVDYYCPDPNCDCRRTTLVIVDQSLQQHAAIIYGWEPRSFYLQSKAEVLTEEEVDRLTQGFLDSWDVQSADAPFFLSSFVSYFRDDPSFREWLETRYRLFKEAVTAQINDQNNKAATIIPFSKKTIKR